MPQPPRRRISDRDRSSLERQLELVSERVDDSADRLAAIDRRISEVRTDVTQSNARLARIEKTMGESFARNFREHEQVIETAGRIAQDVKPTRLSKVKDFVTYVSVLIVPFLLTYLTIVLARGGDTP